jgi:peptide/nickel transport system ATP-binding protein/oligopeptide transport system ATP-binding protein
MYAGRVIERASVDELFDNPQHPYTWGLLGSLPARNLDRDRLYSIPGSPPSLLHPPPGCRFAPRCQYRLDACVADPAPALEAVGAADHEVACHLDAAFRAEQARRWSEPVAGEVGP